MHVACLVPEVLELLEDLVKAYSCLELTQYLYLRGMYCVQSLCEAVSLSWALVVASPLLGFSCILFKMCNLWVNFEASMWSQGKCLRILHLLSSAATAGIMRWKNTWGDCIDAGTTPWISCGSPQLPSIYTSGVEQLEISSGSQYLLSPPLMIQVSPSSCPVLPLPSRYLTKR